MANPVNVTVGVPAIGLATLRKSLTAIGVTVGSPVLPSFPLSPLVAAGLAVGSPAFTAQPLVQVHALTPVSLTVGSPVLGQPGYYMRGTSLAVSSPVLGTIPPTMLPAAIIVAVDVADAASFVGAVPWISSLAATDEADTAALAGIVGWIGDIAATEEADIVRIHGHIVGTPEYWYVYYPDDIDTIFDQEIDEQRRVLLTEEQVEFLEDGAILGRFPISELPRDSAELLYEMSGRQLIIPDYGDLATTEEASDTVALNGVVAFALVASNVNVGSPVFGVPETTYVHALHSYEFAVVRPVFGGTVFGSLHAKGFTVVSPVISVPYFASIHPRGFTVGRPQFTRPALTKMMPSPVGITTGSPVIGAAYLFSVAAANLVVGSPVVGSPALKKVLQASNLTVIKPSFGEPMMTSFYAVGFNVGRPTFSAAFLLSMSAMSLKVGSPQFTKPLLLNLRATNLTIGAADIGLTSLTERQRIPQVTSINPISGSISGGTNVTITGTNLTGATAVKFGGVPARSFVVVSSTTITAVTPAHAVGAVSISVTTPGGTCVGLIFTYVPVFYLPDAWGAGILGG